ncbi:MAG: hypothetical protein QOF71_869 [Candidatus Eremiobacteraeota bacterium]|nr:hypothetical protein [Candidatus Eremiobacteraeota bacterium]
MNVRTLMATASIAGLAACGGGGASSQTPVTGTNNVARAPQSSTLNSTAAWSVYNYNPANANITPKSASFDGTTASFTFAPDVFTARLTTQAKPLTGDLTGKTLHDTITVSGATVFTTHFGGGCHNPPAARFFFIAKTNGPFATTDYWWSDAQQYVLANGTVTLNEPLTPIDWSDINGQPAASNAAAFTAAVANVREIGLSFGGDCFFENGAAGTGTFSSTFTET